MSDVEKPIKEQEERFPKVSQPNITFTTQMMVSLLKAECVACKQRVANMIAFTVHKIKKGKARYTNLIYRIEDWIVDTIKYESDSIYSYAKKTKAAILNVKAYCGIGLTSSRKEISMILCWTTILLIRTG